MAFQFPGLCFISERGEQLLCYVREEKPFERNLALLALSPVLSTGCLSGELAKEGAEEDGSGQEIYPCPRLWQQRLVVASLLSRDDRKCQSHIFTGGKV